MKQHEKYLEVLKKCANYVTIREWATKFIEMYPDEIKKLKENEKDIERRIVKSITSLVSTGKWSNTLHIDKAKKPQKIMYISDEKQRKDILSENIHLSKSSRDVKSMNFKLLMEELENISENYDLPQRHDDKYCGTKETKGIEQIDICQFNSSIVFEMAIRNKKVIEIINKLKYIKELKNKYPYLQGHIYLFPFIEDEEKDPYTVTKELEREYISIAEQEISVFKNELEFSIDTDFSDNYNENWSNDMTNDGIDISDYDVATDELIFEYKIKNPKKKTIVDSNNLDFGKLNIIVEYLENKLKYEYFIYPEGYHEGLNKNSYEEVIKLDSIEEDIFKDNEITEDIKVALEKFRALKPTHTKEIADMFYIYDYYNKRKDDEELGLYAQDIKFKLTLHHGIEIKKLKKRFSYDECYDRKKELEKLKASFYYTEKTITDKAKLMEKFIDKKLYRFILLQ